MNEEYDIIICGTGLTECVLSGLLSQQSKYHLIKKKYFELNLIRKKDSSH